MWNLFRGLTRALAGSRKDPMPKGSSEPHPDQYWELAFWEITNGLWKTTWCINEELHSCPRISEKDSQRPGVGGTDQLPGPPSQLLPKQSLSPARQEERGGAVLSPLLKVTAQVWNKGCSGLAVPHFPQTPASLATNDS